MAKVNPDRVEIKRIVILDIEDVQGFEYIGFNYRKQFNPQYIGGRIVYLHRGDQWVLNGVVLSAARTKKDGELYNEESEERVWGLNQDSPFWTLVQEHWPADVITITYN